MALVRTPIEYEPALSKDGKYKDSVDNYEWSDFQDYGIKCSCMKFSKTVHRNKNSFKFQHCHTKKHIEYLKKLNDNSDGTIDTKELKQLKIQVGREHQKQLQEKQRSETLQQQMDILLKNNSELQIENKQNTEFIQEQQKIIKQYIDKLDKYEALSKKFITLSGYEIE